MHGANQKKAESVFLSVLPRIKPSPAESKKDFEAAGQLIRKLHSAVPSSVEVRLAGSLAKGTDLRGKNEFDIFLLFPRNYSHHEMTLLGLHYARKAFAGMRTESRYAEHPYLQVHTGGYHADIVPAYKIRSIGEKGSSVDRSALHTEYVNSKLSQKGKDEVRLLKAFMKAFGIYGAELRVEGFSGYLCELLICHYGSLLKLMEEAASWSSPALDSQNHHKGNHSELFPNAPLVVIDPVDPQRNVAAVVSQTSLSRFIFECRRFLKSPSERFFFPVKKSSTLAQIKKTMLLRGTRCLLLSFPAPKVVPDVLWPQLKKASQALVRSLSSHGFSVFGYYHWSDGAECAIFFELDRWELPAVQKSTGPQISFASDTDAFVKKHRLALNIHLEHDRMVAVERRAITRAKPALLSACTRQSGTGIPANLEAALSKASLLEGAGILKEKYREFLADYFFAKIA